MYEYLENTLNKQLDWISAADNKVGAYFSICTAMLGFHFYLFTTVKCLSIIQWVVFILATIFLLLSILFLLFVSYPRLNSPKPSMIYFGEIIKNTEAEYSIKMSSLQNQEIINDYKTQIYRNAEIANLKYKYLKLSSLCIYISLLPWLISIIILL